MKQDIITLYAGDRDEIIELHNQINKSLKMCVEKARTIGEILTEIKNNAEHGDFMKFVEQLPFSDRTARNYMNIFENYEVVKDSKNLSEAYGLIKVPKQLENPQEPAKMAPNSRELEEHDAIDVKVKTMPPKQSYVYDYWEEIKPIYDKLMLAYSKLSSRRNHETPKALGHMIGNLYEIAERLKSWNPVYLKACPVCNGSMIMGIEDGKGVLCDMCINGKIGIYKESKY